MSDLRPSPRRCRAAVALAGLVVCAAGAASAFVPSRPAVWGCRRRSTLFSSPMPDLPRRRRGLPFKEEEAPDDRLSPQKSDPSAIPRRSAAVGDPQQQAAAASSPSIDTVMKELAEIQRQGPKAYTILGTRHCSYLHQQIVELLAYALVLGGNHVYTSGNVGTNAAAIRGALRADRPDLLTVVLPQSLSMQPPDCRELLEEVGDVVEMSENDGLKLDAASRLCNSMLLTRTTQLVAFAYHDSGTVIEATREAQSLEMVVTLLYLD
mmetsp:Transcript_6919/g.14410  ORF Transcript_6919/g.14410 Transcript_6919/m.14410 type:complete len:265 (-) Transcript_6919:412-1206(-)